MSNNWIAKTKMKKGALHKQLKIGENKKIPEAKLEAASKKGGKLAKRANFAMTLEGLRSHIKSKGIK